MKKISKILLLVFLSFLFLFYSNAKNISEKGSNIKNDLIKTENINLKSAYNVSFGKIPLYFIQNKGQFNKEALFYARTSKYTIWITKKGLIFDSVGKNKEDKTQHSKLNTQNSTLIKRDVSRLLIKGANKSPEIVPIDTTNYRVNYFTGKDKSKWKTGISTSKAVMYKNIYPYIDLKVYGKEKQIEYDWIIKPGGNPANIRFEFKDVKGTELDNKGNIIIKTEFGKLEHKRPASYQIKEKGKREIINAKFKRLKNNIYKFEIENYDKNKTLIIDPVVLIYSTYLGGGGYDVGHGIAVDSSECAYVTGETYSSDFPLQNPYMTDSGDDNCDVFVTKFSADGQSLIYSTYLGGGNYDRGSDIAVDSSECAYVAGHTRSSDFPLQNPYQTSYQGSYDAFITKLNSTGDVLIYSTYLGGGDTDYGYGIAVDSSECAYVTGQTNSSDFPLQNPYQANNQGSYDAFITKLNPTGDGLIYSTYLGGGYYDWGHNIAVDSSECAYVIGGTYSSDFPLQNPYQANNQGNDDAFITKLNPTGDGLIYSTYLGGDGCDVGHGIAVDSSECAYVTGYTCSSDFPLQNPYQDSKQGSHVSSDVFITKLNPTGDSLIYSTYFGGGNYDRGSDIAVDSSECAYVTGYTMSSDFPLQNPYQANNQGSYDAFITKLNPTGDGLIYSTYLGGGGYDVEHGIAVDRSGCAYITGYTYFSDFPLQNPYQANNQGGCDAFITKLSFNAIAIVRASVSGGNGSATPSKQSVTYGSNASITITPALGYEIASITDNRVLQTITNPYIIENVTKDHLVVITFKLSDLIVRASVSGGNGSATPSTQSIAYGSNASITITPALGYEIASITDNRVLQTITNPYIIENVTEDHLVIITFKVSIRLSMTGVRKTERAWIIKRDYGELNFLVDNPSQVNVSKYVIYKKINNETYEALYEFSGSSLNLGSYIYIDKFLNKDKTYTYKFIAYDSSNNIIAISNEISI